MSKIKGYQMDLEEAEAFSAIDNTTKRISVTTDYTRVYEVSINVSIDDDGMLNSLLANGTPIEEGPSGEGQVVRDLAESKERTFNFQG